LFQGLFEQFLYDYGPTVTHYPVAVCPSCGHRQARSAVITCVDEGRTDLFCSNCGSKIALDKNGMEARNLLSPEEHEQVTMAQKTAHAEELYQKAVLEIRRVDPASTNGKPVCFISYARDEEEAGLEVNRIRLLAKGLKDAGVQVRWDRYLEGGANIVEFINDS